MTPKHILIVGGITLAALAIVSRIPALRGIILGMGGLPGPGTGGPVTLPGF